MRQLRSGTRGNEHNGPYAKEIMKNLKDFISIILAGWLVAIGIDGFYGGVTAGQAGSIIRACGHSAQQGRSRSTEKVMNQATKAKDS